MELAMSNQPKTPHIKQGEQAEELAHQFLIQQGLKPVCQNFRCKLGEIDLIMEDGNTLVFVEVRYRKSDKFGSAVESITQRKQSRIIAATNFYLMTYNIDQPIRFDVIGISNNQPLNWIHNAFQA
jgi:putative endonuclease